MKTAALWTALLLPGLLQDKPETRLVDEDLGFALSRPKDDLWEIVRNDKGRGGRVGHRVEPFWVSVSIEIKNEGQKFSPLKDVADKLVERLGLDADGKVLPDRKITRRKNSEAVFPGAGGPKAWHLDVEIADGEKKSPTRFWIFVDKANPNHLFRLEINGSDELLKKFDKDVKTILGTFQTFKVKKR